jgi:hypothetical protein
MKKLIIALALMGLTTSAYAFGIYTGESRDGMYKICYYNKYGSTVAITVSITAICPRTI